MREYKLVYLNKGGEPLVEYDKDENKLQVVVREILQDKIFLNMDDEAAIVAYNEIMKD